MFERVPGLPVCRLAALLWLVAILVVAIPPDGTTQSCTNRLVAASCNPGLALALAHGVFPLAASRYVPRYLHHHNMLFHPKVYLVLTSHSSHVCWSPSCFLQLTLDGYIRACLFLQVTQGYTQLLLLFDLSAGVLARIVQGLCLDCGSCCSCPLIGCSSLPCSHLSCAWVASLSRSFQAPIATQLTYPVWCGTMHDARFDSRSADTCCARAYCYLCLRRRELAHLQFSTGKGAAPLRLHSASLCTAAPM